MEQVMEDLKGLILQNVEFKINEKIVQRGKIKVFNIKQFFINFNMEDGDTRRDYRVPYPYDIKISDDGMIFDYCLSAFCPRTEESYWKMKMMNNENASKIHENYLVVDIIR